jgi:hypothetical protein
MGRYEKDGVKITVTSSSSRSHEIATNRDETLTRVKGRSSSVMRSSLDEV